MLLSISCTSGKRCFTFKNNVLKDSSGERKLFLVTAKTTDDKRIMVYQAPDNSSELKLTYDLDGNIIKIDLYGIGQETDYVLLKTNKKGIKFVAKEVPKVTIDWGN